MEASEPGGRGYLAESKNMTCSGHIALSTPSTDKTTLCIHAPGTNPKSNQPTDIPPLLHTTKDQKALDANPTKTMLP